MGTLLLWLFRVRTMPWAGAAMRALYAPAVLCPVREAPPRRLDEAGR